MSTLMCVGTESRSMVRVMAQGKFDVLHPGHVHYLTESAALGEELFVVVARDDRVGERSDLYMDEESRRIVVGALGVVDAAVLGSEGSVFDSVERIQPDVITLGFDQVWDADELRRQLDDHGFPEVEITRIGPWEGEGVTSSTQVREAIKRREGADALKSVTDATEEG